MNQSFLVAPLGIAAVCLAVSVSTQARDGFEPTGFLIEDAQCVAALACNFTTDCEPGSSSSCNACNSGNFNKRCDSVPPELELECQSGINTGETGCGVTFDGTCIPAAGGGRVCDLESEDPQDSLNCNIRRDCETQGTQTPG